MNAVQGNTMAAAAAFMAKAQAYHTLGNGFDPTMKKFAALAVLAALGTSQAVLAEERESVRASEYQRSDEGPAIIIRNEDDNTYYEYRVNGELQEIKVVPEVGPTYYLIPIEGGFIRRESSQLLLPSWVLFRW
jgi:hypothetical protein